jgi:uncharacterized repeat protein (TIGR03837 family)
MAPQGEPGVTVGHLDRWHGMADGEPGDVVVEAFRLRTGRRVSWPRWRAGTGARTAAARWINLEYLTAEGICRTQPTCLPSPVLAHGPGAGMVKHFYLPGFTPRTGGLLREPGLKEQQARFGAQAWRTEHGIKAGSFLVSLFCYEPPALPALLDGLAAWPTPVQLLVTAGRATAAVRALDWQARAT